jgi:hypothetical protein
MFVSNGNAGADCVADSSHERSRLMSPLVPLPESGPIRLSFDAVAFDEAGSCPASGEFDAKAVTITTDGGETYTVLNDCFPLVPPGSAGVPMHHDLDISAWAGQAVRVMFVYDTMDSGILHTFGVDNVTIYQP